MRISAVLSLPIILFFTIPTVFGQAQVFEWQDVICSFKGTYNSEKISRETIEDTRKLIDFGMGLPLQTDANVWRPAEIDALDVKALDAEYKKVRADLLALKPVESAFFKELKASHLRTLDASYELKRVTLLAHKESASLKDFKPTRKQDEISACYKDWGAPVVAGGDVLLSSWKRLLEIQKQKNASPESLQARFDQRWASPERAQWALLEVLSFGWWNCINKTIPYVMQDGTAEGEFRALFTKVDEYDCDEPE